MKIAVFCIALVYAVSTPAFANPLDRSGNDFLAKCSALDKDAGFTDVEMARNMECLSYIRGLIDGATYEIAATDLGKTKKAEALPFCRPKGVGDVQFLRAALKYVRDNPEKAHLPTVVLIFAALRNAFPCLNAN
jgi:hypothetical protein